jgi:hypothetical protein
MIETLLNALRQHGMPLPDKPLNEHGFTYWCHGRYWAIKVSRYHWAFGDFIWGSSIFALQNPTRKRTIPQIAKLYARLQQEQKREHQKINLPTMRLPNTEKQEAQKW